MTEHKLELEETIKLKDTQGETPGSKPEKPPEKRPNVMRDKFLKFLEDNNCGLEDILFLSVLTENMKIQALADQRIGAFIQLAEKERMDTALAQAREREGRAPPSLNTAPDM